METTLLTAGIICLIGAVVGGGVKAFGAEIPQLASGRRQILLGILGVMFLLTLILHHVAPDIIDRLRNQLADVGEPPANSGDIVEGHG